VSARVGDARRVCDGARASLARARAGVREFPSGAARLRLPSNNLRLLIRR
jgi:hypothetical protein